MSHALAAKPAPVYLLTKEQVEKVVPATLKSSVTQALVDEINQISADPLVAEQIRSNFLSYTTVMADGKFKLGDYLNAVAFVSYKLMGMPNQDAYFRTFPGRHAHLIGTGATPKDVSAYVSAYSKGKLVNAIMQQSLVPSWVLNQDLYQKALNVQAGLMMTSHSDKVRTDAANSLLVALARPKDAGPGVQITINEHSGMNELRDMLTGLARKQQSMIQGGIPATVIAEQRLIQGVEIDGTVSEAEDAMEAMEEMENEPR